MSEDIFKDPEVFEEESKLLPQSILDLKSINKAALGEMSGAVIERVEEGFDDPLEVYIKAKALQELSGNIIKGLKDEAMSEAEKYSKADSSLLGCEFTVKNGSTSYSFDHDEVWSGFNNEISAIKEKMKLREKMMVDATNYSELTDDAGNIVPPAEIKTQSGQILSIKIPRK
jgi:hypothetical protein